MRRFLLRALNENFRPTNLAEVSFFPPDEFDESEALRLKGLCDLLYARGYDELFERKDTQEIRDIVDLAAEYGAFVEKGASPWYLGVFIAAECLMEPYATDSFYEPMLRSQVFSAAPDEWKNLALWLMQLAFFCDRLETAPARMEAYAEACFELGFLLDDLPSESFCNWRHLER